MPQESLQKLYDTVSQMHDIGDFETFTKKMQDADSRQKFYGAVSATYDLGDFATFEGKVQVEQKPGLLEAIQQRLTPSESLQQGADVASLPAIGETALRAVDLIAALPANVVDYLREGKPLTQSIAERGQAFKGGDFTDTPGAHDPEKRKQEPIFTNEIKTKIAEGTLTDKETKELREKTTAMFAEEIPATKEEKAEAANFAFELVTDPLNFVGFGLGKKTLNLLKLGKTAEATKAVEEIIKVSAKSNIDDVVRTLGKTQEESVLKQILTDIKAGKNPDEIIAKTAKENIDISKLPEVKGKRTTLTPEEVEKDLFRVKTEELPEVGKAKTRRVKPIQKGQEPLTEVKDVSKARKRRVQGVQQKREAVKPGVKVKEGGGKKVEAGGVLQAQETVEFRGLQQIPGTNKAVVLVDLPNGSTVGLDEAAHILGKAEKAKLGEAVKAGKYEGILNQAEAIKLMEEPVTKSGKEYAKGLAKAIKEDIKGEKLGVIADPDRNLREFLTKNKLKLTDDEVKKLKDFAKKTLRGSGTVAEKEELIRRYANNQIKARIAPEVTATEAAKVTEAVTEIPAEGAVEKVTEALKEVKPLRGKQERIYTKERGKRITAFKEVGKKVSGEEGFKTQKARLKGEHTKVQFESLREKVGQEEIDALYDGIKNADLDEWDKLTAGNGLSKLLGEAGGTLPTKGEISLLKEIFGSKFTDEIINKRSLLQRFKEAGLELANIPRSLMASFDLSAPFRQGIFTLARHPKVFFSNFAKQFRLFGSEKYYQQLLSEIHARPTYKAMQENKLALTELGDLTKREEIYMSNWAEKIPLVGRGVRASGRAYTGFLDRMRADLFDQMVEYGVKHGIDDPKYLKDAANFINAATGRGSLWVFEKVAVPLNTFFFSPRLLASRIKLLWPGTYIKLEPAVRKEALKSLLSFAGMGLTVSGIAKMAGAEVEIDPRNANFAKIKIGNTRYDPLGGFQQPIRAAAQIISGKIISSTTGKEITLGEGYRALTGPEIATRFLEMKEAPLVSFAMSLWKGKTAIGEKVDVPTEIANRFIPMVAQDMHDMYRERGLEGIPMAVPAIFGVGVQTYGGVQTWGLDGKNYPRLNKELQRLKTSMGFPSTSAFGKELTNAEYKKFRRQAGVAIASNLNKLTGSNEYKKLNNEEQIKAIEKEVDRTKREVREKLFSDKKEKKETESIRPKRRLLRRKRPTTRPLRRVK